jgi:hypothetical protein
VRAYTFAPIGVALPIRSACSAPFAPKRTTLARASSSPYSASGCGCSNVFSLVTLASASASRATPGSAGNTSGDTSCHLPSRCSKRASIPSVVRSAIHSMSVGSMPVNRRFARSSASRRPPSPPIS